MTCLSADQLADVLRSLPPLHSVKEDCIKIYVKEYINGCAKYDGRESAKFNDFRFIEFIKARLSSGEQTWVLASICDF